MPTKSRPSALPLLSWQGPGLCICQERIDGGVFPVVSIHSVEFFPNTGKSLALDICGHRICIKLASRPAPSFCESVGLFEERIRDGNCGFHEYSITTVIPRCKRLTGASEQAPACNWPRVAATAGPPLQSAPAKMFPQIVIIGPIVRIMEWTKRTSGP